MFLLNLIPLPFYLICLGVVTFVRYRDDLLVFNVIKKGLANEEDLKRHKKYLKIVAVFQPATTVFVLATAALSFLSPTRNMVFSIIILIAAILSLVGDSVLIDTTNEKSFILGFIFFTLVHIAYTVALAITSEFFISFWAVLFTFSFFYVAFILLSGYLGKMKMAVFLYLTITELFLLCSVSAFFGGVFSILQAVLITAGCMAFLLGDLRLAYFTFRPPEKVAGYLKVILFVSPILYFGGQILLALSPSYFK